MHRTFTPFNKTDLSNAPQTLRNRLNNMQPSDSTIQRILQFAASYRVQKINDNQYIDMILN